MDGLPLELPEPVPLLPPELEPPPELLAPASLLLFPPLASLPPPQATICQSSTSAVARPAA